MGSKRPRAWGLVAGALALALLACQAKPPAGTGRSGPRPQGGAAPSPAALGTEQARPLAGPLQRVGLIGEVRLISDHGGGILSNNGGTLLSDAGGGLVSNNGGALISDHGGGLLSNHGSGLVSNHGGAYRLAQGDAAASAERPASESFLADAEVEFLDAQGQRLVDAQGAAISARTDRAGVFRFQGDLPSEPLVARVRLWQGGQLLAMLVPDAAASGGTRLLSLSTASSLGAAYVLDEYVQARPEVYAKLPPTEVRALYQEAEAALGKLGGAYRPSYRREALRADLGRLRGLDGAVDARMERIRALLLAGQAALGEGLLATQVALSAPMAAFAWKDGATAIVELVEGRLRLVDAQGRLSTPKLATTPEGLRPVALREVAPARGGGAWMVDRIGQRAYRLGLDGALRVVAGNGQQGVGPLPMLATQSSLQALGAVAEGPDGTLWLGEVAAKATDLGRLLRVDPQGQLHEVALPPELLAIPHDSRQVEALAAHEDGSLAVLVQLGQRDLTTHARLLWRSPDGAWGPAFPIEPAQVEEAHLLAEADGGVLLSLYADHRVRRVSRAGESSWVAGTGEAGLSGDGGPATAAQLNSPAALWRSPSGALWVADAGNGLIRVVEPDGRIRTVAGASALAQAGDALAVSINGPGGLAVNAQGEVVVGELFTSTIKVLRNQRLEPLAGKGRGFQGDGGPALAASFDTPTALAFGPLGLAVADAGNLRIRLIEPSGRVRTVAGSGKRDGGASDAVDPLAHGLRRPMGLAQAPDGTLAWCDNEHHCVWRLKPGASVAERVAGTTKQGSAGLDGPGHLAQLSLPIGLAFGPDGLLYIADTGNLRVLRLLPDGRLERFAGAPFAEVLPRLQSQSLADPDGTPRLEAALLGPGTLAFDPQGRLYVGEVGTTQLDSVLGAFGGLSLPAGGQSMGSRIRQIGTDGRVITLAGPGGRVLAAEEGDDALGSPSGLAFDGEGRLIIADGTRNQLKVVPAAALR